MSTPNGGLINETNAQYYAGSQQFYISTSGTGKTFTSTFDTNLIFGNSDPATNGYNLNNFKVFTSPDASTWSELSPIKSQVTGVVENATSTPSLLVDLVSLDNNIQIDMVVAGAGISVGTKVASINTTQPITGTVFVPDAISLSVNLPNQTGVVFNYTTFNAAITINNYIITGGNIPVFTNNTTIAWFVGANVVNGLLGTLTRSTVNGNTPTQPDIAFTVGQVLTANPYSPFQTSVIRLDLNNNILPGMRVSGSTSNAFGTGKIALSAGVTVRSNTEAAGKSVIVLETGANTPGAGTLYTFATTPWNGDTLLFSSQEITLSQAATVVNGTTLSFRNIAPFTESNNVVTVNTILAAQSYLKIQMNESTLDDIHGSYEYTRLHDVIDNFMIAYIGAGKLITSAKRTDIIFHARRGLQEFSYDTLKSSRSQELEVPSSLSVIIPQDYVNYVKLSWADEQGVLHIIYPTNNLNQSPYETLAQDDLGNPIQDSNFINTQTPSQINAAWEATNPRQISGAFINNLNNANAVFDQSVYDGALGQRYGLEPQVSQKNGWFKIDESKGTFNFSSNLKNKIILVEYISDGNAYDLDARIPKLAEEALYSYIIYAMLSVSRGIQEYIVKRFQKEKSAKLRNAKIRLSNLKLDQIIQVMRGKSKWIK